MLDAYIIDRIRRERESREIERAPLRIEPPQPPPREEREETPTEERGVAIVDFRL